MPVSPKRRMRALKLESNEQANELDSIQNAKSAIILSTEVIMLLNGQCYLLVYEEEHRCGIRF